MKSFYRIKLLLITICCLSCTIFIGNLYSLTSSNLENLIDIYFKQFDKNINHDFLETNFAKSIGQITLNDAVNSIVKIGRENGVFLEAFRVKKTHFFHNIRSSVTPFIAIMQNGRLVLVNSITDKDVQYCSPNGITVTVERQEFLKQWDGAMISQPLVNEEMELYPANNKNKNDFYIVYSYHNENFEDARPILDNIFTLASNSGKQLIYVDELGLIPKRTIEDAARRNSISEKEAFEKVKSLLVKESSDIEKGIPLYDPTPFYNKLYKYLANNRTKTVLEDLRYQNWKQIVKFDDLNLQMQAEKEFFSNKILDAVNTMSNYFSGFWVHNVQNRGNNFLNQLIEIKKNNSNSLVFTLRGIGHYGLGERLHSRGYAVKEVVIGGGKFSDNFASGQLLWVLKMNNVNIPYKEGNTLILKNFVQELLRSYLMKKYNNLNLATRLSKTAVDNMKLKDVIECSFLIEQGLKNKQLKKLDDIQLFVYKWVKGKGFTNVLDEK